MKSTKNYYCIIVVLLLFIYLPLLSQTSAKERFRTVHNEND